MNVSRRFNLTMAILLVLCLAFTARAEDPTFVYETVLDGYYLSRGVDMVVDSDGNAYVIASWYQDQQ